MFKSIAAMTLIFLFRLVAAARAGRPGRAALLPRGRAGDQRMHRWPDRRFLGAQRRAAGVWLPDRRAAGAAGRRARAPGAGVRAQPAGAAPRERRALRCAAGPAGRRAAGKARPRLVHLPQGRPQRAAFFWRDRPRDRAAVLGLLVEPRPGVRWPARHERFRKAWRCSACRSPRRSPRSTRPTASRT